MGRRWNIDPVRKAWESSYATFSNSPIYFNDPNGDDAEKRARRRAEKNGGTVVKGSDGTWSVDGTRTYEDPLSSTGKGTEVVSTIFRNNIFDKIGNAVSDFWKNSTGVAEFGVKVDIGVQAKANIDNLLKIKADVVSYELAKGKLDFIKMFDSNTYDDDDDSVTGSNIFNGDGKGVNVEQGLEAEVNLGIIGLDDIGVGGAFKHSFNTNGGPGYVDYDVLVGVPVLKKVSDKSIDKVISKTAKEAMAPLEMASGTKAKGGKKQDFYGLDLGAGVAIILGVDLNIKLGFKY